MLETISTIFGIFKSFVESIKSITEWRKKKSEQQLSNDKSKPTDALIARFLSIFESLDIPRALIPRVLNVTDLLSVQEACSNDLLATKLDDRLIKRTADRLAISSAWLYGSSTTQYQTHHGYGDIDSVFEQITSVLEKQQEDRRGFESLLVISNQNISDKAPENSRLVIVLCNEIDTIENIDIHQYHTINTDIPWDHKPARLVAKEIILLGMTLGIPIKGITTTADKFKMFENGSCFLWQLTRPIQTKWHPDDFVANHESSYVAKDVLEATFVRNKFVVSGLLAKANTTRVKLNRSNLYDTLLP